MRTKQCDDAVRRGRLRKNVQFKDAAELIREFADTDEDIADAYITLCVHAGIAAADAICCVRLGYHARGDNHREAVDLLGKADQAVRGHLENLLRMKTRSGYGHETSTSDDVKRAGRAAAALVGRAEGRVG